MYCKPKLNLDIVNKPKPNFSLVVVKVVVILIVLQSGVKSNLPRDDINLQFCRGVLKERRSMLEEMKINSIRRKSLLDPQTILLLKSQEESNM